MLIGVQMTMQLIENPVALRSIKLEALRLDDVVAIGWGRCVVTRIEKIEQEHPEEDEEESTKVLIVEGAQIFGGELCGGLFDTNVYSDIRLYWTHEEARSRQLPRLRELNEMLYDPPEIQEYSLVPTSLSFEI